MTRDESAIFFDREVKGRFPDWQPADVVIQDWLGYLNGLDIIIARDAIKQHRFDCRFKNPDIKAFYYLAKNNGLKRKQCVQIKSEPILAYRLKRADGVEVKFFIPNETEKADFQTVESWSSKMCEKFKKMYGHDYVIIRDWESWPENKDYSDIF